MQLNFGLLTNQQNPLNALQAGYETGLGMAKQRAADNALNRLSANPDDADAYNALAGAAPDVAQQVGARMKMQRDAAAMQQRRQARSTAFGVVYDGVMGGQRAPMAPQMPTAAPTAPPQAPMAAQPAPAPNAPDMAAQPGDEQMQTVEAPRGDPAREAFMALAEEDPQEAMQLAKWAQSASKEQRDAVVAMQEPLGAAAYQLLQMPETEWQAAFAQMEPMLMQRGVTPEMLQTVELSRAGLQGLVTQTLGLKGAIAQANAERDDGRADEQLNISRANLGVAQANLGLRAREVAQQGVAGMTPRQAMQSTMQLRKEFANLSEVKNFKEILPVLASARNAPDTPAGDIQLAYTVGKILDPNSVVREGELALVARAGSPLERILGTGRYVAGEGARLTPIIRRQLLGMLNERGLAVRSQYDAAYTNYASLANDYGMDARQIVGRHAVNAFQPSKPQTSPTKPGQSGKGGWGAMKVVP